MRAPRMLPCGDVAKEGVGCQHAFWLPLLALHWSLGLRGGLRVSQSNGSASMVPGHFNSSL